MKILRKLLALATVAVCAAAASHIQTWGSVLVNGGGNLTFEIDLDPGADPDGDLDGAHFGLQITINEDGSVMGELNWVMAGNTDFGGVRARRFHANVLTAQVNEDGSVTFAGSGVLWRQDSGRTENVPFTANVTGGGAGIGTFKFTEGRFKALPLAMVRSGEINVRLE